MSTPRTDDFALKLPPVRLRMEDFRDRDALLRVSKEIREQMMHWATFARQLEDELHSALPRITPTGSLPPPTPALLTCHDCRHQQRQRAPCEVCGAPAERVYL